MCRKKQFHKSVEKQESGDTVNRREVNSEDRRTKYTRRVIREALMELLKTKPYTKVSATEICRMADINRGTFYIHYYVLDDVLDDILDQAFCDVSGTIDHVLCPQKETCTYPFCQKVQSNPELGVLFSDQAISEKIIERLAEKSKPGFVAYLMEHSQLTYEQAESIFYFQINGCMTINRMMLQNNSQDWHAVQQTIDRFIRAGLQEFLTYEE